MMDLKTSFKILDLDQGTDDVEAKRAYKAQVRRWHPDQFPAGSTAKAGAEEQLKRINVAYARVKAHLAIYRPDSRVNDTLSPTHSPHASSKKSNRRSWFDRLLETLNAFSAKPDGKPQASASLKNKATSPNTFEQVLDEMGVDNISSKSTRHPDNPSAISRPSARGYPHLRPKGDAVGAVGSTESPGPIKPVGRVRGIGKNR